MHARSRKFVASLATGLVSLILASESGSAQMKSDSPKLPPNLAAVRNALAKYEDPLAAIRDGYFSTLGCVDFPKGSGGPGMMSYKPGGMGVHFLNAGLIGPKLDPLKPQILLYQPVGDKLKLVGVEYFVPLSVSKTAPMVLGTKLDGPMVGHTPVLPATLTHWDLHVWLWKDNPNGIMHSTNSTTSCPPGPYTFHEGATRMVTP